MGLFDIFKASKRSFYAGGNFTFIAQVFATQYTILRNTEFGIDLSRDKRLFAAALINLSNSLFCGKVTVSQVEETVNSADFSRLLLDESPLYGGGVEEYLETGKLFNLLLNIENLTFRTYTKQRPEIITEQILVHLDDILDTFIKTLRQGTDSPLYEEYYPKVIACINETGFQTLVYSYTPEEDHES